MKGIQMAFKINVTMKELSLALLRAWCADTARGSWRVDVPALNQCAVTALIVQDYFGGDLKRQALNDGDSHYWNDLPYFSEVDLTFSQFAVTKQFGVGDVITRSREYVLSFPDTKIRYELLKKRVERFLDAS
jgi:hypothetical protein